MRSLTAPVWVWQWHYYFVGLAWIRGVGGWTALPMRKESAGWRLRRGCCAGCLRRGRCRPCDDALALTGMDGAHERREYLEGGNRDDSLVTAGFKFKWTCRIMTALAECTYPRCHGLPLQPQLFVPLPHRPVQKPPPCHINAPNSSLTSTRSELAGALTASLMEPERLRFVVLLDRPSSCSKIGRNKGRYVIHPEFL